MAQLSGDERKILHQALLSAFPTLDQLDQLINFGLGDNLQRIAGNSNLDIAVTKLIQATETTGRTKALLEAAIQQNPGNVKLAAVAPRLAATLDRSDSESPWRVPAKTPWIRRLLLLGVASLSVSVVFARPSTTFDLALSLDRLSLEVNRWSGNGTQTLFASAEMPLQIAGFNSIDLGGGLLTPGRQAAAATALPEQLSSVTLVPSGQVPSVRFAHGILRSLNFGPAARLTLEHREESQGRYALWIAISESEEAGGAVELRPTAQLECSACGAITGMDANARRIVGAWTFQSNGRHLTTFRGKMPRITLWPEPGSILKDTGIVLKNDQRIVVGKLEDGQPRSVITGQGSIGFESLRDTIPVGPGDYLEIRGVRRASIASLGLDTGINVRITGIASSIRVGPNPEAVSERQPTLLRHLVARKDPTLLYVGLVAIGAIGISILIRPVRRQKE